jgi:hypothetical protein
MNKIFALIIVGLFPTCILAQEQKQDARLEKVSYKEFSKEKEFQNLFSSKKGQGKDGTLPIQVNRSVLASIWEKEPKELEIRVPLPDKKAETYRFEKTSFATEDFAITTSDGRKLMGKEYLGLHYKLSPGQKTRIGGISFREDGLMGVISHENGNYNIGEAAPGKGNYLIVDDSRLAFPGWDCKSQEIQDIFKESDEKPQSNKSTASTLCKPVRVFMEADFQLYSRSSNNMTTATNFVTGLFNLVSQLFRNESINLQLSGIFVWTTTDPYATMTSSITILNAFAANRPVSGINGNLTHLLSARSAGLGGIAYTGIMCNSGVRHGFSNIHYQYSALPTYSWSVNCVTHELGHNFGSKHTHWCGWSLPNGTTGRIDSCWAGEGSCGTNQKTRRGTIMSYCHVSGGGIDFNLGFGPLPGKVIRDGLTAATCIASTGCLATPTVSVDSTSNRDRNFRITISIPANHNGNSWNLLENGTVIQTGSLANQNAATITVNLSNKPNGTYSYSARLSSSVTSNTSSSVSVVVAVPIIPPSTGNCTATGLTAWFGTDGKLRFRFGLSSTCNSYRVEICRYNLSNPSQTPVGSAVPVACGVRNGMTAYSPTTAERTAGFIERVADPQPANASTPGMGSFWYSVDVTCNGTGCTTTNRTRTYIFVPGI